MSWCAGPGTWGRGLATALVLVALMSDVAAAQSEQRPLVEDDALEAWVLVGANWLTEGRWNVTTYAGHLGGPDAWIVFTDATVQVARRWQVWVGHVHLEPTRRAASAIQAARGGIVWHPLRRAVAIDNRFLLEHRWLSTGDTSVRARNRVRGTWTPGGGAPRLYASIEALAVSTGGIVERRHQIGVTQDLGRADLEVYWLRALVRGRPSFDAIGVTALWHGVK